MNKMLVSIFDNESAEEAGLQALRTLHGQGDIKLYATGVMVKDAKGVVSIKESWTMVWANCRTIRPGPIPAAAIRWAGHRWAGHRCNWPPTSAEARAPADRRCAAAGHHWPGDINRQRCGGSAVASLPSSAARRSPVARQSSAPAGPAMRETAATRTPLQPLAVKPAPGGIVELPLRVDQHGEVAALGGP